MKKILLLVQILVSAFISADASISDLLQQNTRSMPVQMDMLSENGITICTGDKKSVGCRDGANMAVTNAFWGRISDKVCPSDDGDPVIDCDASPDTLQKVKGYCEGKKECNLIAKHEKLQKNGTSHCPGVNKYLVVNYTCIPESRGVTLCQDVATRLSCEAGWVMELADVFWGRRANNAAICGDEEGIECDNSESASKYLKNKCNNRKSCHIKADPNVLSNKKSTPCLGKYLMVNYICRPSAFADTLDTNPAKEETKMQDSSSKELMGLLEKHLTEIKEPASVSKKPAEEQSGKQSFAGMTSLPQQAQQPLQQSPPLSPAIVTPPAVAPAASFSLGGTSTGNVRSIEKTEEKTAPKTEKKSEEVEAEKESLHGKGKPSSPETPTDDDSTSVRSILARAKDILKTLDMDGNQVRKRQYIAYPANTNNVNRRTNISHLRATNIGGKKSSASTKKFTVSAPATATKVQQRAFRGQQQQQQNLRRSSISTSYYPNAYPENFRLRSWYGKY